MIRCKGNASACRTTWEKKYFDHNQSLISKTSLAAGQHSFPFEYILPIDLPSTFTGQSGKIYYTMRATLKYIGVLSFKRSESVDVEFTVISSLDLNRIVALRVNDRRPPNFRNDRRPPITFEFLLLGAIEIATGENT